MRLCCGHPQAGYKSVYLSWRDNWSRQKSFTQPLTGIEPKRSVIVLLVGWTPQQYPSNILKESYNEFHIPSVVEYRNQDRAVY